MSLKNVPKVETEVLADGRLAVRTPLFRDPETGEISRVLECGDHQIIINRTQLIRAARVPDLNSTLILSLEESREFLKFKGLDSDFVARICHDFDPEEKYSPTLILNLAGLKGKNAEKTKVLVVKALAHEMRHAQQHQDRKKKGKVWSLIERRKDALVSFKAKKPLLALLMFSLWSFAGGFTAVFLPHLGAVVVIAFLLLMMFSYMFIQFNWIWQPLEKDARKFADGIAKDKDWLDCVEVEVIEKIKSPS